MPVTEGFANTPKEGRSKHGRASHLDLAGQEIFDVLVVGGGVNGGRPSGGLK
jgi:hypothetical protein